VTLKTNTKQVLYGILSIIVGGAWLLLPLVGAALSLQRRRWILALLRILAFFGFKQVLLSVQKRLGVRSLTIAAPWLRRKRDTDGEHCCPK